MARHPRGSGRSRISAFVITLLVLLIAAGAFSFVKSPTVAPGHPVAAPQPETPVQPEQLLSYEGAADPAAELAQVWIYGTHLGMTGTLTHPQAEQILEAQLVLHGEDGSEQFWPLRYTGQGTQFDFRLSDQINGGILLDALAEGSGLLLLRLTVQPQSEEAAPIRTEHLLTSGAAGGDLPLSYYTVTQNGANRCITLESDMLRTGAGEQEGLIVRCTAAALPPEVYDIVIDAGHGGTDAGSLSPDQKHYEKDIVLEIAHKTKAALEELGYKVLLTRDGTEDPKTKMAYTMYDADGRVTRTIQSRAKLCFSLHLNSYDGHLDTDQGGVQIYAADRMDYTFASLTAQCIADAAGSYPSAMAYYNVAPGVFCRTFTQGDSDELDAESVKHNFTPYRIPVGTNYYYIIRETGCRITGAYIDGRHPHYGENAYRNDVTGVETYLCELGYINLEEDLQKLLHAPESYAAGIAAAVQTRFGN